jgi:hypothetical protein
VLRPEDIAARMVTDDEVAAYRRDGWVKIEQLISPTLAAEMLTAARAVLGEDGQAHRSRPGVDVDFTWWNDYHFAAREGIEPFRSFSYSAAMGRNSQRLQERDVAIRHFTDHFGSKAPAAATGKNSPTPVHQDYPAGHWDRVGNTTFWIALEDMPAERGVPRFYSGSHREGPLGYRGTGDGPDLLATYPWLEERYELSPPTGMKAGDATCHSQLVLHRAPANTTDVPRWQYITMYFPADAQWTGVPFVGPMGSVSTPGQLFDDDALWPVVLP